MSSVYKQAVQRQAALRAQRLRGETENPLVRGAFLTATLVIFGMATTLPTQLMLLAGIGLVLLLAGARFQ